MIFVLLIFVCVVSLIFLQFWGIEDVDPKGFWESYCIAQCTRWSVLTILMTIFLGLIFNLWLVIFETPITVQTIENLVSLQYLLLHWTVQTVVRRKIEQSLQWAIADSGPGKIATKIKRYLKIKRKQEQIMLKLFSLGHSKWGLLTFPFRGQRENCLDFCLSTYSHEESQIKSFYKTLPEAQRTQGIDALTWVISPANKNNATCIGSKFGHQVAPLA